MYAIIEVGGVQYKISGATTIRVPKIEKDPGKSIELDRVLLLVQNDEVSVGKPVVPNVKIQATVVSHGKAKKILVFKKKRRKGYKVLRGHRQEYTDLRIDKIGTDEETRGAVAAKVKKDVKGEVPAAKSRKPGVAAKKAEVKAEKKIAVVPAKAKKTPAKPVKGGTVKTDRAAKGKANQVQIVTKKEAVTKKVGKKKTSATGKNDAKKASSVDSVEDKKKSGASKKQKEG